MTAMKKIMIFILVLMCLLCAIPVYSEDYNIILDDFIQYANDARDSIKCMYEDAQELIEEIEIPEDER